LLRQPGSFADDSGAVLDRLAEQEALHDSSWRTHLGEPYDGRMDSNAWDERYGASDLVWSAGPNLFLPPLVEDLKPGTALDLACGEGRNAIWLASNGWAVMAVDYSPVGIEKARRLAGDTHVQWVVGDVTTWTSEDRFDLVVIFYLHLPPDEFAAVIRSAIGMLAAGGTIFGVGHAVRNVTDGYGGPPYPEILWSEDRIEPLLAGLNVIELGERTRYVEDADATAIDVVFQAQRSG